MSADPLTAWHEALARLHAWTPTEDGASLLAELAGLPAIKAALPPELESLRALRKRFVGAGDGTLVDPAVEHTRHPLFRLLATQRGYTWPWDDAEARVRDLYRLEHDDAFACSTRWATLAASVAPVAFLQGAETCASIRWLETCLLLRQRPHWLPAALAIAELCAGPMADTPWARDWEDACAALAAKNAKAPTNTRASRRHRLTIAVVAATIRGATFGGKDAAAWIAQINDVHEVSATAGALLRMGAVTPSADVLLLARARFESGQSYQVWDEARSMLLPPYAASLPEDRRARLLELLLDPPRTTLRDAALLEDLYDAGETLRWLRANSLADLEPRLLAGRLARAPGVARAIDVPDSEWTDRVRGALARLWPDQLQAMPRSARVAAFAEAFTLIAETNGADLWWPNVAGPALRVVGLEREDGSSGESSSIETSPGKVSDVAWIDISVLAIANKLMFQSGVHKRELDALHDVDGRPAQATRGIRRLVAARWRRSERDGVRCWLALPDATQAVATHIVRRCMRAGSSDEATDVLAQLMLAVIAADAPAAQMDEVRAGGSNEKPLWTCVEEWLPATKLGDELRVALQPALAMESARLRGDLDQEATTFVRVLETPGLAPLAQGILSSHAKALDAAAKAPARAVDGVWTMPDRSCAGPRQVRDWWKAHIFPLAQAIVASTQQIATTLRDAPDPALRRHIDAIKEMGEEEVHDIDRPAASEDHVRRWRAALDGLREIARLQPWHVERALERSIDAVDAWLSDATHNEEKRTHLIDQLRQAMAAGNEDLVLDNLDPERERLLDSAFLRSVGHFFLGRLNFSAARSLPARAEVPNELGYFWPLVVGIVGGPLTAIQTNYIWEPVLASMNPLAPETYEPWKYWSVVGPMFLICLFALGRDARRRLPDLSRAAFIQRCAFPFFVLFLGNYIANEFVYEVAGRHEEVAAACPGEPSEPAQPRIWTVLLWGSLSMYLGVFFGLIAQGNRIDEQE